MKKSLLKIFIVISALVFSNSVWGFKATADRSTLNKNFDNKSVSWKSNHVTFTLSGNELYTSFGYLYMPHNATYTLSWSVEPGYDIIVKTVAVDVDRASGIGYKMTVGNGTQSEDLFASGNIPEGGVKSGTLNYGNTQTVSIVVCKAVLSTCAVKSITIEYNLKPQINASNGSVGVTICDDNKNTIDLKTLAKPVVTNGHVSYSYSIQSVATAANTSATTATGHISGSNFYATQAGIYTIKIATTAATCHEENSKTFTVTVTPAALTLTAPTASDITYRQALSASNLTGGSAKVGSCDVAGTWTWKDPKTTPSIGDNQSFTVVFTPFENAGNYTNFETKATINVKRAQFVFDGGGTEEDDPKTWCYAENWAENQIPGSEDQVLIDHNVVIRQEVSVYSVTITEGDTLTIMPTGGLTVGAGGIIGATTGNLILKAGTEGETKGQTGYLRISPEYTGAMPEATVELYTIGYTDMATGDAAYQYVGSPVQGAIAAKTVFNKSVLQAWNEEQGKWYGSRNSLELNPFTGYITTQTRNSLGWLITNAGQLVANENITINLSYTATSAEPGCNVLANSFAAPIDITKFIDDDFHNIDSTIYLFNTGSRNDMEKKGVDESARGQYLHLPIGSLRAMKKAFKTPTVIAPMQGFCVNALNEGAYITLNYERLVWGGTESNTPLRVKKQEEDLGTAGALCISLVADNMGDNLYLLESEEYDILFENGYDARKRMSGELNVFSIAGNEKLGVDATNSIIGTRVGVRTGAETAYTFVFSHLQSENGLALYDADTEQTIDIDENTEYTFFAAPETEITNRFQIVARADAPAITTGVDGVENEAKAVKFIKDDQIYILKNGVLYNAMGAVVR